MSTTTPSSASPTYNRHKKTPRLWAAHQPKRDGTVCRFILRTAFGSVSLFCHKGRFGHVVATATQQKPKRPPHLLTQGLRSRPGPTQSTSRRLSVSASHGFCPHYFSAAASTAFDAAAPPSAPPPRLCRRPPRWRRRLRVPSATAPAAPEADCAPCSPCG